MREKKIVGVLMTFAIFLAFITVVIILMNPFRTVPVIRVLDAYWELDKDGYVLVATISTTKPVQLLGVEAGRYYGVVFDIEPPNTTVRIHVDTPVKTSAVRFYFNYGSPIHVSVRDNIIYKTKLKFVFGEKRIFLYGTLTDKAVAFVVPVSSESKVGVFVHPGIKYAYSEYISKFVPEFNGDLIGLRTGNMSIFEKYTTIIFADITPDPTILNELIRKGKHVVLFSWKKVIGEERFKFVNNTVVFEEYPPDRSDIDYFGAHCIRKVDTYDITSNVEFIKYIQKYEGAIKTYYGVMPSAYCTNIFINKYISTKMGDIVLGRTRYGFYFASLELRPLLLLAMTGFFDGKVEKIYIEGIHPFRGVYPLHNVFESDTYMVTVYTINGKIYTGVAKHFPILYSRVGDRVALSVGVDKYKKTIWSGEARIRVVEATYDGDITGVITDTLAPLPTTVDIATNPFRIYLLYVNDTLSTIVADETVLEEKPYVSIDYSSICEMFFLDVKRLDSSSSVLTLYINGKPVAILRPGSEYKSSTCKTGFYDVEVKDVYGRVIAERTFQVAHIYEQPMFIVGVLSLGGVMLSAYWMVKRRAEKEVEEVVLIFYRLPDVEEKTVSTYSVAEAIRKLSVVKKASPTITEVIERIYKRHPVLKTALDVIVTLYTLLKKYKGYVVYSRYVPEIDDTITLIGEPKNIIRDFYLKVLSEVMIKFGGTGIIRKEVKEIIDVDYVLILGNKMLLLTFAPSRNDIKDSINRVLTAFVTIRKMRLPFKLVGFAVLTEPRYVSTINSILDDLLNGDRETAAKLLKDMTIFTRISEVPKDMWLSHYIMVAAPITRIAPLLAFAKVGAVRLCNKYYRLTTFLA